MKLEVLLGGLNNPNAAVRLDVVRVLGMLDETRALDAVRQRYQVETDDTVKGALSWAGKRLFEAQQGGYSTLEELIRHFGIDREIENMPDPSEAEMMRKLQDSFDADLLKMQQRAARRRAGTVLAAGLGGAMLGGATMGFTTAASALSAGAEAASSGMGGRPQIGTQRTPATAPSNADISIWLRRLREERTPDMRQKAAIELGQLNNPAALPHLAAAFVGDSSPIVREAAQRFGKILYWRAIYWDMEQSGEIEQEIERRARAIGKLGGAPTAGAAASPEAGSTAGGGGGSAAGRNEPSQDEIRDILRKADQARKKRNRR